jgi:hypothetical protein
LLIGASCHDWRVDKPGLTDDFVHDRLANGGALKMLCILDEHTRECSAIEVGKSLRSQDVILALSRLVRIYGKPAYIQFDMARSLLPRQS